VAYIPTSYLLAEDGSRMTTESDEGLLLE
jgi:hypothetical protein